MANIETGIMQGDPTPILIANAWAFGARTTTLPLFQIMRRNAEVPGAKSQDVEERPGLKQYLERGTQRFGQARIHLVGLRHRAVRAARLRATNSPAWRYFHHARSWKNLYNPQTGWLRSRNADGSWKPLGEDWRESTYKNYFWMVPYDLAGLISRNDGRQGAASGSTNSSCASTRGTTTVVRLGQRAIFHIRGSATGSDGRTRPRRSSTASSTSSTSAPRRAAGRRPGHDGAWYVFACTGLCLIPGVGGFTLSTPVFDKVVIHLKHGDITITGGSEKQIYTTA